MRAGEPLADGDNRLFEARLLRRLAGEPVHRILGRRAFYDHEFRLSPETLEPRPDTETLVELARRPMAAIVARRGACLFADAGTGTGAIAVSLLALVPEALALAVDLAPGALLTAQENARAAGVADRFLPFCGDYLSAVKGPLDLVVANPPYIATGHLAALPREVRLFDPVLALDGGPDGLAAFRVLARQSAASLRPGGATLVEIGAGQGADVRALFHAEGLVLAASANDLSGTERALWFDRPD